ncbi:MAG TPA: M48 family metalloprotease [Bryobacteraceae bacterium]|nr:M48 family metalloprotease [Bryobacteraceae bacterium]
MKRTAIVLLVFVSLAAAAAGPKKLKPGFNLFSKDQDVQLGKEAAGEIEKQVTVINHPELNAYLQSIGKRLADSPEAAGYPYTFKLVADKSINAFALPGGPTYVNTGLIAAADNEAQLAGVIAHEISHVALRHGTNQASKAQLVQLPAVLAGSLAGNSGSILGGLTQLGIGLGANSVLLKFSRTAETEADLLGARMLARSGWNPVEMARFFEKLQAEGGSRMPQFLSSHPDPGNRQRTIEQDIRYLPQRSYSTGNATEFARAKQLVAALPAPPAKPAAVQGGQGGAAPALPDLKPSSKLREFSGKGYTISHPDNWRVVTSDQSAGATIAPEQGVVQVNGGNAIGAGLVTGFHVPQAGRGGLQKDTDDLLRTLISQNTGMKAEGTRSIRVDGSPALAVTLRGQSPFANTAEVDTLITVDRSEGLFYVVLIAPEKSLGTLQSTFDAIVRSIRFGR